jgi:hypothetical protein
MNTSAVKIDAHAIEVLFDQDAVHLVLADGREVSAPLEWFPRLRDASPAQQSNWRLIGRGLGVHWPDIDEDISVQALLKT